MSLHVHHVHIDLKVVYAIVVFETDFNVLRLAALRAEIPEVLVSNLKSVFFSAGFAAIVVEDLEFDGVWAFSYPLPFFLPGKVNECVTYVKQGFSITKVDKLVLVASCNILALDDFKAMERVVKDALGETRLNLLIRIVAADGSKHVEYEECLVGYVENIWFG